MKTDHLLRIADVAKRCGFTLGTAYVYVSDGILPPPAARIGNVNFFDPDDVDAHMELHADVARPFMRKSVQKRRRRRSART